MSRYTKHLENEFLLCLVIKKELIKLLCQHVLILNKKIWKYILFPLRLDEPPTPGHSSSQLTEWEFQHAAPVFLTSPFSCSVSLSMPCFFPFLRPGWPGFFSGRPDTLAQYTHCHGLLCYLNLKDKHLTPNWFSLGPLEAHMSSALWLLRRDD